MLGKFFQDEQQKKKDRQRSMKSLWKQESL